MARKPAEFESHPYAFEAARQAGCHRAVCKHIVDGDTFDIFIDLGLRRYDYLPVRLRGYNAAELFRPQSPEELESARRATAALAGLILGKPILVRTYKDAMSFDRFVADAFLVDGSMSNVAELMKTLEPEWTA